MAIEVRAATAEEMVEFTHVWAVGLGLPGEKMNLGQPEETLCVFEDGKMVSTYRAIPFTLCMNGKDAPVAGIADVATLPMYRRRGHLQRMMVRHFEQMHEQGKESIIILWPSRGGIYRRFGCDFVTMQIKYRITPRDLRFTDPVAAPGGITEVSERDFPTLAGLYHDFAAERTGYLHRPADWWREHALSRGPSSLTISVLYSEGNAPRGYLIYVLEPVRGEVFHHVQKIILGEIVYLDMNAFRALWQYLAGMDLIGTIELPSISRDDPLPYLLAEPRALVRMESASSTTALMGRIVDVERALPQRGYQTEGRLTFEIKDEWCPWNEGRWEMEISGGMARVARTRKSPQVVMPADTLAMLTFNYTKASYAARIGKLDVLESGALAEWDRIMNTAYDPFCPDHF